MARDIGAAVRAAVARLPKRSPHPQRSGICRGCGCTNEEACNGGCWWVDAAHTYCSACYMRALAVRQDYRQRRSS